MHKMHGAPFPFGTASRLAIKFGQHLFDGTALGNIMGMTAMGTENPVLLSQSQADTYCNSLLSNGKVGRTPYFLLGIKVGHSFLRLSDEHHEPVDIFQKFAVHLFDTILILAASMI
jgi:hypothetical protein